jgi:hypothetical protein
MEKEKVETEIKKGGDMEKEKVKVNEEVKKKIKKLLGQKRWSIRAERILNIVTVRGRQIDWDTAAVVKTTDYGFAGRKHTAYCSREIEENIGADSNANMPHHSAFAYYFFVADRI